MGTKNVFFMVLFLAGSYFSNAQKTAQDSVEAARKDSLKMAKFFSLATYPLIKNSKWSGVLPVDGIQEKPDPAMRYKLLMEVTLWSKDSAAKKEINGGLGEVGRLINLHVAAGVPKENLDLAVIIHGPALNVYLKNEAYQKKFGTPNPNIDLLKQFLALGVKFIACGQAMAFFDFKKEDMIPEVRVSLSAKVVVSTYQLKGYVLYDISEEK